MLPSVCVGNVAQLAVDLLISSLEMRKVATIWHVGGQFNRFIDLHIFSDYYFQLF